MLSSFHTVRDIALAVTLLGRLGLLLNQRHLLLSVLCIERRLYGVNLFLVALSILLDDRSGLLFALFVLTLAAAESALALALLRSYFQVHGSILLRAELFTLQPMPVIYKSNKLVTLQRLINSKFHGTVFSCFSYETSNVKLSLSQARSYSSSLFGPSSSAFLARLTRLAPSALYRVTKGERRVKTTPTNLLPLLTLLKEHTGREFTQLRDITAVDRPERKRRFEVVYSLLSIRYRQRLRVSVTINELDRLPSVTSLFPSAGWYERETAERFGLSFHGHPDLRRLRLDYGFKGHPLRKDFPATGYVEVRFDEVEKRIQYEEVSLAQEFRQFTLEGPWSAGA